MLTPKVQTSYTVRKAITEWLAKSPSVTGFNVQTGQMEPAPTEWDEQRQQSVYCPQYCLGTLQGIGRDREASGQSIVALEYDGTVENWSTGRYGYRHQIRLIVAIPIADIAGQNECYNLRDYLVNSIQHGLCHRLIDFGSSAWTGEYSRSLLSRVQWDEEDKLYLASVTLVIGLK